MTKSFSGEDLKRLEEKVKLAGDEEDHFVWIDKVDALLARLLDAENVIMVHGEDCCTACQKWRLSCGLPKNKSV